MLSYQPAREEYALITGATSGFGYEFAKLFAAERYNLILVARNEERLEEIRDELNGSFPKIMIRPFAVDLFSPDAPAQIHDYAQSEELNVEYLINDAGQGEWGYFSEVDLQRNLDIIQLNVISLVSLTKFFLTDMIARKKGGILQVGSEAGKTPMPLLSVYAATKAFVTSFTEGLANELRGTNVGVTLLMPGASDTDFFHKAHANYTRAYREEKLASARKVARDGFNGLMRGDKIVISGIQTKLHIWKSKLFPDESNAESGRRLMELSHKAPYEGRMDSMHAASRASRAKINALTGRQNGDYPKSEVEKISFYG